MTGRDGTAPSINKASADPDTRPFEGLKIIDLTHVLAGPFSTYQMALLGADVIKVERPSDPDQTRRGGSDKALNQSLMGTNYLAQGANKRSLTIDLKTEAGRKILKQLVVTADVVVENYRPGAMDALGLGYEGLSAINPRLIYASLSAFGSKGPRGTHTGYDPVLQASAGVMMANGTPEVSPVRVGTAAIDYASGTTGAFALAAALYQRERTGRGQFIDLSMLDVALILMGTHVTSYERTGKEPEPHGNQTDLATTCTYQTADGLILLSANNLREQRRLWLLLGHGGMAKQNNEERRADFDREFNLLRSIMRERTAADWEDYLQSNHVPAARVRPLGEALSDPQLDTRGILRRFDGAPGVEGEFTVPVAAFQFAHGGPRVDSPPPRLGEHDEAILHQMGYSDGQIADLRSAGVVLAKTPTERSKRARQE